MMMQRSALFVFVMLCICVNQNHGFFFRNLISRFIPGCSITACTTCLGGNPTITPDLTGCTAPTTILQSKAYFNCYREAARLAVRTACPICIGC
ncbi:Uncharacterised protein g1424 [Pycnogonum litorale]